MFDTGEILQNRQLTHDLNYLYSTNNLFLLMELCLKIKLLQIVLGPRVSSVVVMSLFNVKQEEIFNFILTSVTM